MVRCFTPLMQKFSKTIFVLKSPAEGGDSSDVTSGLEYSQTCGEVDYFSIDQDDIIVSDDDRRELPTRTKNMFHIENHSPKSSNKSECPRPLTELS